MTPLISSTKNRLSQRWTGLLVVLVLLSVCFFIRPQQYLAPLRERLVNWGPWAPALFILIYIVACIFMVLGSALTLVAGTLFGITRGTLYVSAGSTLGATFSFLLSRFALRNWIEKRLDQSPSFAAVADAVAIEGWKSVFLLRLSPAFPFNFLNYALGLTRVSFHDYVLASWLGMLPGTVLCVRLLRFLGRRVRGILYHGIHHQRLPYKNAPEVR
ncbi:MAG: TVP38/TMEM64 family protein [Pedosphaera sp.]|nr:TVP38/TMEM64 family protein [Pedosphaera sp.]